ncbi:MAG: TlpA disulfide reductase family protein [Bacteroidales bacterium]|jgi:thiol-disulfide isomerase/thioredoxin
MDKVLKYLLVIILVSCLSYTSYSQSNKNEFIVQGNIISLKDTMLSLTIWDSKAQNGTRYANIPVSNGKFEYKGSCEEPIMVRGWINDPRVMKRPSLGGFYPVKSSNIWFIIYPGAKVTINGKITDFSEAYPSDGGENDILSLLTRELFPILNESVNNLVSIKTDHRLTQEQISEKEKEIVKLDQKSVEILKSFIATHASSVAALWFMDDMLIRSQIELKELEKNINKVDPKYFGTSYYKTVKTKIEGSKNTSVGCMVPDVVSDDTPDKTHFDLKSLRGKYVIIDFWGTWCMPCLKGMPAMREFRDKYKSKVEILGIAKDGNIEGWKREIIAANLNWFHILNGTGYNDFVAKFNVQGYPTKIVIDPNGKIIYRITGESDNFYTEVSKLIAN